MCAIHGVANAGTLIDVRRGMRTHRHKERGLTLLEIMIVLAILAIVMGIVIGPMVMNHFAKAKVETTALKIHKYAYELYPQWAVASHEACPNSLTDLDSYMKPNDEWGHPLTMTCGTSNPPGVTGIGVRSSGPNGTPNDGDDIVSWQ